MPNFANTVTILECARNAGVRHPQDQNLRVGGHYHPAYTNAKGKPVAARWQGQLAINHRPYRDAAGNPVKVDANYIRVTVWSAKGNPNGLAESYARSMCIGMELITHCTLKPFMSDIYDNNVRLIKQDGTPVQVEKMGFTVIPGTTIFIRESDKRAEGEAITGVRPLHWNVKGHEDYQTWSAMIQAKNNEQYVPGKAMFGYAVVVLDKGAQANVYGGAGAGLVMPNTPLVEGFTIEQWKAKNPGMTDEIILSNPMFENFHAMVRSKAVAGTAAPQFVSPSAEPVVINTQAPTGAFRNAY